LQIVVTVVAAVVGNSFGLLAGAALTFAGNLLINALIPRTKETTAKERQNFQISGFRNRFEPDGAVPMVLGQMRVAPAFVSTSWTEIVGDEQYIRCLFTWGEGPYEITDLKIGDTPFDKYDEIQHELRTGLSSDAPITLYPNQVLEEAFNVEVARPLPRDDQGNVTAGAAIDTPVSRFIASDSSAFAAIFYFPSGLAAIDNKGRVTAYKVVVSIRYRKDGIGAWTTTEHITFTAAKTQPFYRQVFITLPERGRYEVEFNCLTAEVNNEQTFGRLILAALQSIRPEYPINYNKALALLSVRIKATYQLNGSLDNVNAVVGRICKDWDALAQAWVNRVTKTQPRFIGLRCKTTPMDRPIRRWIW
jgi:hypothetical protein